MAYWNPFGWSEETRRSIQSVVRPVMQVASMAASMGAFSGGGAAAASKGSGSAGGAAAAAGTDMSSALPFETGMDLDLGIGNTYGADILSPGSTAPFTDVPTGSLEFNPNAQGFTGNTPGVIGAPQPQPVMTVPDSVNTTDKYIPYQPENPGDPILDIGVKNPNYIDPNATGLGGPDLNMQDMQNGQPIEVQPHQELVPYESQVSNPEIFDRPDVQEHLKRQIKPATAQDYRDYGLDVPPGTPEAKPPATKTPDKPKVDPPKTEGPGPGGVDPKNPFKDGFNWENIKKFLESPEGRKWLLMDEKGLAGIGRKLSAAADAGVSGNGGLTREERKKIYARLKKEREEKKRRKRRRSR